MTNIKLHSQTICCRNSERSMGRSSLEGFLEEVGLNRPLTDFSRQKEFPMRNQPIFSFPFWKLW